MTDSDGSITVAAGHSPLAFLLTMTKFVIEVDGIEHEGPWGERTVSVAPGQHTVRMWFRYLGGRCGAAEVSVSAAAGATTSISYRAPVFVYSKGKVKVDQ